MEFYGYIGTYSKGREGGIFRFVFRDGVLEASPVCDVENPSFLCFGGKGLLAVSETATFRGNNGGSLAYLEIGPGGTLKLRSQEPTFGKDPCYVDYNEKSKKVVVANYSEGTASVFNLEDGILSGQEQCIVHAGKGKDPVRQEMAHVHCTAVTPDREYFAVCDLGLDRVVIYRTDGSRSSVVYLPGGTGPRHVVFHQGYAYVNTELSSEIYVYAYGEGKLTYVSSYPLLPADFSGFSNTAAVKVSPCGRFLAASNRGHNSLVTFRIREGGLAFVCRTATEGDFPRDFAYTPDGKYILCANQLSEEITVFSVDEKGFSKFTGERCKLPKPVAVLFDA